MDGVNDIDESPASRDVLDDRERRFVYRALHDWDGPAYPTDAFAVAMGFGSAATMPSECERLWERIDAGESLDAQDWRRVMVTAEVAFASDVVGVGIDWEIVSPFSDEESIAILRGLQRKLIKLYVVSDEDDDQDL